MAAHVRVSHLAWLPRLGASAAVIAASTAVAIRGVPDWEESLFRTVHDAPDWLEPALWAPMQLGSAVAPAAVAVGAYVAWRRWRPAVGALVVGVGGWWLAKVVKELVERGRPHSVLGDLQQRAGAPTSGLGFLSGHATVAFALAAVLSPYLARGHRAVAYGLAAVVAVARVHVGAHFPLDVVAGAALGYGLGWTWHVVVGVPEEVAETVGGRWAINDGQLSGTEAPG